jgi:hypothetical protein|tara:strand:- start:592 stop:1119 length:528 start_codon:yes stop_codon:yes gene_type:complete
VAQVTSVTSEVLQAEIRRLLPSQQGFGEDLQASNVITPIIDLTAAAEGSGLPVELQQALNHTGSVVYSVTTSANVVIANVAGFYRVRAVNPSGLSFNGNYNIFDGTTSNVVYDLDSGGVSASAQTMVVVDFYVFLRSGDSLRCTNGSTSYNFTGTVQQVADVNGNLVNPVGFTPT